MLRVRNPEAWGQFNLEIRTFNFPDGEPHISSEARRNGLCIEASIASSDDLMRVLMLNDILRHNGATKVNLFITYLMGARMDRRMPVDTFELDLDRGYRGLNVTTGNLYHPFTLGIISELLLTGHFDHISILDPHSDVAPALLHAEVVHPDTYVADAVRWTEPTALVAPDAGAAKKVQRLGEQFGLPVIQALKKRDQATGKLTGCQIVVDYPGPHALASEKLLIVDDICDGGRTFENIASEATAMGASEIYLYVTHGIFSKGLPLKGIDKIITTNSYQDFEPQENFHYIVL